MTDRLKELRRELERVRAERDLLMKLFVYFERFDGNPRWVADHDAAGLLHFKSPDGDYASREQAEADVLLAARDAMKAFDDFEVERKQMHAEDQAMKARNRALGFDVED